MIIPLKELEDYSGNIYEATAASVRRAYQITITGDDDIEAHQGKIVSTAIRQILTGKVQFQIEE
jgi:DNA-directed RNA polymerase subunit omega